MEKEQDLEGLHFSSVAVNKQQYGGKGGPLTMDVWGRCVWGMTGWVRVIGGVYLDIHGEEVFEFQGSTISFSVHTPVTHVNFII